jgi:hypothetical protein
VAGSQLGAQPAALRSQADSIAVVRGLARALAIGLKDEKLRSQFNQALKRSTVREGKLLMQKFVRARGASLAQRVELLNGMAPGTIGRALQSLGPLELYLPIPEDRKSWRGTGDILVAGFIETEDQIRQSGGTVTAYDLDGREHAIAYDARGRVPVIVLTNAETESADDGESAVASASSVQADDGLANFCIGCPLPPPPPDPCLTTSTGTKLHVCRTSIPNVGRYEGALRGSPEVAILLFSVLPTGRSTINIGCMNEDLVFPSYYNQDGDSWVAAAGFGLVGTKAAVDQARAAGRAVTMLIWEDDNGSKCVYSTSTSLKRDFIGALGTAGMLISFGWLACAANDQCNNDPPLPVFLGGAIVAALSDWILSGDDDPIGAVVLPAGTDPFTNPRKILLTENGSTTQRGLVYFSVRP